MNLSNDNIFNEGEYNKTIIRLNNKSLLEQIEGSGFEEITLINYESELENKLIEAIEKITEEEFSYEETYEQITCGYAFLLKKEFGIDVEKNDLYYENHEFICKDALEFMIDESGLCCPHVIITRKWFESDLNNCEDTKVVLKGKLDSVYEVLKLISEGEAMLADYMQDAIYYAGSQQNAALVFKKGLQKKIGLTEDDLKKVMGEYYYMANHEHANIKIYEGKNEAAPKDIIKSVTTGYQDFLLSAEGQVFILPQGSNVSDEIKLFKDLPKIKEFAAGNIGALFLSSEGEVFACDISINDNLGSEKKNNKMVLVKLETVPPAVTVSAAGHCLITTAEGKVCSFGHGLSGQLGNKADKEFLISPLEVKSIQGVVAASAGSYRLMDSCGHSLFLLSDGSVFSCGCNSSGQLGLKDNKNRLIPACIYDLPPAVAVSAGALHSLVLTADGLVYSFGKGAKGRLGHGDEDDWYIPAKITGIPPVKAIAAGESHSLILTHSGVVYSFGEGLGGQLGHSDQNDLFVPTKIEMSGLVSAIDAGYHRSILLLDDGGVRAFGEGSKVTKQVLEF